MGKKNKKDNKGFVYSTDPDFSFDYSEEETATLLPEEQSLKIRLETKHRSGKTVTVILGFTGSETDLQALGKKLKSFCGTGGSAKDGEIIVQGDQRKKVLQYLSAHGYRKARIV